MKTLTIKDFLASTIVALEPHTYIYLFRAAHFAPGDSNLDSEPISTFHRCALRCSMSGHIMRQARSAQAAWERGINSDKPCNYSDK